MLKFHTLKYILGNLKRVWSYKFAFLFANKKKMRIICIRNMEHMEQQNKRVLFADMV